MPGGIEEVQAAAAVQRQRVQLFAEVQLDAHIGAGCGIHGRRSCHQGRGHRLAAAAAHTVSEDVLGIGLRGAAVGDGAVDGAYRTHARGVPLVGRELDGERGAAAARAHGAAHDTTHMGRAREAASRGVDVFQADEAALHAQVHVLIAAVPVDIDTDAAIVGDHSLPHGQAETEQLHRAGGRAQGVCARAWHGNQRAGCEFQVLGAVVVAAQREDLAAAHGGQGAHAF